MAIQKRFDVVGILVLALLTALGGGILRDLIIGDSPPAAFTNVNYLVIPLAAAVVTFFGHRLVRQLTFTILVFDAAGLGLFSVTGTLKALSFDLGPLQAVLLGITTAVGGGMLRDITARETPALVQVDTDLYWIPAAAGAVVVAVAHHTHLPMLWLPPRRRCWCSSSASSPCSVTGPRHAPGNPRVATTAPDARRPRRPPGTSGMAVRLSRPVGL